MLVLEVLEAGQPLLLRLGEPQLRGSPLGKVTRR